MAIFTKWITCKREGEPLLVTTVEIEGSYSEIDDIFRYNALDRGAREVVIEQAKTKGMIEIGGDALSELGDPPKV